MMEQAAEQTIVLECLEQRVRRVVVQGNTPCEYAVEYGARRGVLKDAIFVGRVVSLVRGTQSAFVDIGIGKNAILHAEKSDKAIAVGALLLVQVQREPPSRDKGPRVTQDIQIPGRLCVLSPRKKIYGVSQKITDPERRAQLVEAICEACPEGMGAIARTLAQENTCEALRAEIAALVREWEALQARARGKTKPGCVSEPEDLIDATIRELLSKRVRRIVCDSAEGCERIARAAPQFAHCVEHYEGALPVLDAMQLESRLQKALAHRVYLKSGATLVIDHCEAMTVVDVNSGKNTGARDGEQLALRVNLEAAEEIALQLRLRDLGGIIVVDFIDMQEPDHREQVLDALRKATAQDRSRVQVGGLSPLGLCEMTRKALRREVCETIEMRCTHCGGRGRVKSVRERAYDVLLDIRRRAFSAGDRGIYLLTADRQLIQAVEKLEEPIPCSALFARAAEEKEYALVQLPEGENTAMYLKCKIRSVKQS